MNNLTKNSFLVLTTVILSFLIGLFFLKLYSDYFGRKRINVYLCEPRPGMWMIDSTIGYKNKPDLNLTALGGIKGHTNNLGFRTKKAISPENKEKKLRIFGLGDSVMWGTRVNQEDSFLGLLEETLKRDKMNVEVINIGVVGYLTYQEYLFLKKDILPLKPDIVLVNFCNNDWLPSEDPFRLTQEIYKRYISSLLENSEYSFEPFEREILERFSKSGIKWNDVHNNKQNPQARNTLFRVLLEIPILKMADLAKEHSFDLIYLFIPDTIPNKEQIVIKTNLQKVLKKKEIVYLDLYEALRENKNLYQKRVSSYRDIIIKTLRKSKIPQLLHYVCLGKIDPVRSIEHISGEKGLSILEKNLTAYHSERNFIDEIGHPSKKGNRIIANEIYKLLSKNSNESEGNLSL